MSHYVKLVVNNGSSTSIISSELRECLPHVHDRQLDLLCFLRPKPFVEHIHACLRSILSAEPDRLPSFQVADHYTIGMSLPQGYLVYPDCPRSCYRIPSKLFLHVFFVQGLDRMPVQLQFFCHVLDGHGTTLPSHVVGKPLRVEGIVRQPGQFLPLHFPTPLAPNPSDFHFQVDPSIPTGQIPYPSHCLVVITVMQGTAATACRFF